MSDRDQHWRTKRTTAPSGATRSAGQWAPAWAALLTVGTLLIGAPYASAETRRYSLPFIKTQNAPAEAQGIMTIRVTDGQSRVHFQVSGAYPNTLYTIWTVFNVLTEPLLTPETANGKPEVPSTAPTDPPLPVEANAVSPTAKLGDGFTSGMGPDPGASFSTDDAGFGEITVKLDFDLVNEAALSNKDIIRQCAPDPTYTQSGGTLKIDNGCTAASNRSLRVTTTWLRKFVADIVAEGKNPAVECANYDARFDPLSGVYDALVAKGQNARLWQCVDPASGLPRVHRFKFNHFRLANHPDDLTHGFIGGNGTDHWIDMVGRRADLIELSNGAGPASLKSSGGGGSHKRGTRPDDDD
jgi:hypothetical protein